MLVAKLKLFYIASILTLVTLTGFIVFRPMVKGAEFTEVRRDSLLKTDDEWIVQFDIINCELKEQRYQIMATVNGRLYSEDILVLDNRVFTYIYHIVRDDITDGDVMFVIYRENESIPIKQVSYHLQ